MVEVSSDRRFRGMPAARVRVPTSRVGAIVALARVAGLAPGRRYWYRFRQRRTISPVGSFRTAPRPAADRASPVRLHGRRRRHARPADGAARLQRVRGLRPHGRRAQRLQHQPRRHDLLGQQRGRPPAGADRPGEGRQVPGEPRVFTAPPPARGHRALQPLGRPRVRQRLLRPGARRRGLPGGQNRVHGLRTRRLVAPGRPLPTDSAGAARSSSSSSTSARSGARRRARPARATSRRPHRKPSGTRSPRSPPGLRSRSIPPASLR